MQASKTHRLTLVESIVALLSVRLIAQLVDNISPGALQARDECVVTKGEAECAALIEAHKVSGFIQRASH